MDKNRNLDKGKRFGEGQSRGNNGRKKKIVTILKDKGYSKDDIRITFLELAFYTESELEEIKNDKSKPIIIKIVANQLLSGLDKSDWSKVKDILEHTIGKPRQEIGIEPSQEILPTNFLVMGVSQEDYNKQLNIND